MRCKICDKSTTAPSNYSGVSNSTYETDSFKHDVCYECRNASGEALAEMEPTPMEEQFNSVSGKTWEDRANADRYAQLMTCTEARRIDAFNKRELDKETKP